MGQIDLVIAKRVKKNIEYLLKISDLTWDALAEGAKVSSPTLRRVFDLNTNLSKSNRNKIEIFYGITLNTIDKVSIKSIPEGFEDAPFNDFKNNNTGNRSFFKSKTKLSKAAHFVRKQILKDDYFKDPHQKKDMINRLKASKNYKTIYTDSAMAKEIERLHKEDKVLFIEDTFSNSSIFKYFRKN
ncbi:hypothetical protein MM239_11325 [Belliella sp. DSM 111904]|uniref:HTH cro/C1-type domain-containing protein n=1 Tax=Belliella filtrata TaxID=2923435 RepID=A0ABS9V0R5_9BACT|nr:hypothetical protein [Belliella filtrata]MCH7409986.1 hypothetical protein [Belliella filtrata]